MGKSMENQRNTKEKDLHRMPVAEFMYPCSAKASRYIATGICTEIDVEARSWRINYFTEKPHEQLMTLSNGNTDSIHEFESRACG